MATLTLVLGGCAAPKDRLAYESYARMQPGAWTQSDVRDALGEPDHVLADIWLYERPEKHLVVKLEFGEDGQLERKEWIDATNDTWEDTKDQ